MSDARDIKNKNNPGLIGADVPRADAAAKVSGRAQYTADMANRDALHGAVFRSPVAAGRIRKLDLSAARSAPGVRAVVSAEDCPDNLAGWAIIDTPLFARNELRFQGEPIAAVAADTLEQAQAALKLIALDLEETTPIATMAEATAQDARPIHPDLADYGALPGMIFNRKGNCAVDRLFEDDGVDAAFDRAARIVEDRYEFGRQYQAYLEPKGCIAIYDGDAYQIDTGHQYIFNVRDRCAQFLGCKPSQVNITGQILGGGFGGKLDYGPEPYAALLAKAAPGRRIKLIYSREEDMLVATSRENAEVFIRTALDENGKMIGRELLTDHDNGAYSGELPLMAGLALMLSNNVYKRVPTRARFRLIYTNTAPTGAYRGVSAVPIVTAIEWHMDHIAEIRGEDPRDFRRSVIVTDGDTLPNGQKLDDANILSKAFDDVEEMMPWKGARSSCGPLQGVGISGLVWLTNPLPTATTVKLNEDGTAHLTCGTCDIGTGAIAQGVRQIVADSIGIAFDDVVVSQPDTRYASYDGGSQGSRTTRSVGTAAREAALQVRERILSDAAELLQASADELDIDDGFVHHKADSGKRVALVELLAMAAFGSGPIVGRGKHAERPVPFDPGCANGLAFPALPNTTYHVHAAKVEVDPATGNVDVLQYVVAQEVGKAINPAAIMGQIQGGVTQGIGYTLHEGLRLKDALYIERSLEAYRLPLALDVPRVEARLLEHPAPDGAYGVKGAAEPPILLGPSVIGNAIYDAIGVRIPNIPITPEDVLFALQQKRDAA